MILNCTLPIDLDDRWGDAIILLSNKTYCVYGTGKILLYLSKNIKAVEDGSRCGSETIWMPIWKEW